MGDQIKFLEDKLIQMEKMASLGMLSAGVMHEIQNPLNFINNLSSSSKDLFEEFLEVSLPLVETLPAEEKEDLLEIIDLLQSNMSKIAEHGTRVDDIVRGMLSTSRDSNADKIPVDMNKIIAQYVHLGYHAMRANHRGFNVKITEEYSSDVGVINVVRQEISRAILNIVNNACYAVFDKSKHDGEYKPEISIRTSIQNDYVKIDIRDNGNGIPAEIKQKIFEPFFTTKPDDQGTGLGLMITKEIIEKSHAGKLSVHSEEGQFAEFTIHLPFSS